MNEFTTVDIIFPFGWVRSECLGYIWSNYIRSHFETEACVFDYEIYCRYTRYIITLTLTR